MYLLKFTEKTVYLPKITTKGSVGAAFCTFTGPVGYLEDVLGLSNPERRLHPSGLKLLCELTSEGKTWGVPWLHSPPAPGHGSDKLVLKPCQPPAREEQLGESVILGGLHLAEPFAEVLVKGERRQQSSFPPPRPGTAAGRRDFPADTGRWSWAQSSGALRVDPSRVCRGLFQEQPMGAAELCPGRGCCREVALGCGASPFTSFFFLAVENPQRLQEPSSDGCSRCLALGAMESSARSPVRTC